MNILADLTARNITATARPDIVSDCLSLPPDQLPLAHHLLKALQLFLHPSTEADAIVLCEHVCETWRAEHAEVVGTTWH